MCGQSTMCLDNSDSRGPGHFLFDLEILLFALLYEEAHLEGINFGECWLGARGEEQDS